MPAFITYMQHRSKGSKPVQKCEEKKKNLGKCESSHFVLFQDYFGYWGSLKIPYEF